MPYCIAAHMMYMLQAARSKPGSSHASQVGPEEVAALLIEEATVRAERIAGTHGGGGGDWAGDVGGGGGCHRKSFPSSPRSQSSSTVGGADGMGGAGREVRDGNGGIRSSVTVPIIPSAPPPTTQVKVPRNFKSFVEELEEGMDDRD